MCSHREVPIDDFGKVVLPHFAKRLRQIINDKSIVISEEVIPHLRDLPTRKVEVQTIDEGHVVAYDVRQWRKEVAGLNHDVDRLVGVSEHRDARLTGNGFGLSNACGAVAINPPGALGSGMISSSSLEGSNVDLAQEFTNMIRVQRAYSASSKIVTTVDDMLQEVSNLKR